MKKFLKNIRNLLEYFLFIILIKIVPIFSIDKSSAFFGCLMRFIGKFLPATKIAKKNLKKILGNDIDHDKIINELLDNFGRYIGEFPYIDKLSNEELDKRIEITGFEHIERFRQSNQPFFICTGHFANWDIMTRLLPKLYPNFSVIYRSANNAYIDKIIKKIRSDKNIHLIPKGQKGVRSLLTSIKAKDSIVMLVDQKMNDGISVPFMGKEAMSSHAIAKLAIEFNYPIIPCQIIRTKGAFFKVVIHKKLDVKLSNDNYIDCYNIMLNINQIIESWVRQNPSQWFWFHNRWGK